MQKIVEDKVNDGKDDSLDVVDSSEPDIKDLSDNLDITYSFDEIPPHPERTLEYMPPSYEEIAVSPSVYQSDEESISKNFSETTSLLIDAEEAEEIFVDAEYATAVGSMTDVSNEKRESLDWFIKCHPSYFGLIQSKAFTRDVNFAPW